MAARVSAHINNDDGNYFNFPVRLPLDCVLILISELLPKVQNIQASRKATSTTTAIDLLSSTTLEHVLPPPSPVTPRQFLVRFPMISFTPSLTVPSQWSDASVIWLTSLIWGEIYVRGMTPLGIWNGTNVRLFYVKHTQTQQRQLSDTVTNVVGGLLRRTSENQVRRP